VPEKRGNEGSVIPRAEFPLSNETLLSQAEWKTRFSPDTPFPLEMLRDAKAAEINLGRGEARPFPHDPKILHQWADP
jgi:hypothetical protein